MLSEKDHLSPAMYLAPKAGEAEHSFRARHHCKPMQPHPNPWRLK
jgi:hypothetical protein